MALSLPLQECSDRFQSSWDDGAPGPDAGPRSRGKGRESESGRVPVAGCGNPGGRARLLVKPSEQTHSDTGGKVFARYYRMARVWGLVDFAVELSVEYSQSLPWVCMNQRSLVAWAPVPVNGVPRLGLLIVDVVGRCVVDQGWLWV